MSEFSLWRLCQEHSIYYASLLIAGHDPDDFQDMGLENVRRTVPWFNAVKTALCNAVVSDSIQASRIHYDEQEYGPQSVNIFETLISVSELIKFIRSAGVTCDAFERGPASLLADATSPFYSKKLDAANRAWQAVSGNPALLRGRSPKQALEKWLAEHAKELGLLNKDGQPNRSGIEEISKVANWKPEGGAIPTPSAQAFTPEPRGDERFGGFRPVPRTDIASRPQPTGPRESFSADLDDEIPF
ncbi:MAG: hypothetical protein ABSF34_19970 [Verrucomicrobiota bacterium]